MNACIPCIPDASTNCSICLNTLRKGVTLSDPKSIKQREELVRHLMYEILRIQDQIDILVNEIVEMKGE